MEALIVGGGVAGPVTALALQRAGIEPVIYEAYPCTDVDAGSYLTVAANGLDALHAVGVRDAVTSNGFPTAVNVLCNHRGRRLGTVTNGGRRSDGTVAHTVKRARLAAALRDAAMDRGVRVEHGARLVEAHPTADGGVVAVFADGREVEGDVLIGADGIHSTVRSIIDPAAPVPRYAGLVNFGGYTPGHAPAEAEPGAWHMVFGKEAFFGYVVDPNGGTVWFVNLPRPQVGVDERRRTTEARWKEVLLRAVAGDGAPAADLIRAGQLELAGDDTHDLPSVPTWHRDAMVIIGDAAHAPTPSSGQGASMAAEDAVVLAQALRDQPDVPSALVAYEALRRERVERIVAHGARTSSSKTPGPAGRVIRDAILPLVFRLFVTDRKLSWIHDHHLDWEAASPADSPR